jgi:hypothetical protein
VPAVRVTPAPFTLVRFGSCRSRRAPPPPAADARPQAQLAGATRACSAGTSSSCRAARFEVSSVPEPASGIETWATGLSVLTAWLKAATRTAPPDAAVRPVHVNGDSGFRLDTAAGPSRYWHWSWQASRSLAFASSSTRTSCSTSANENPVTGEHRRAATGVGRLWKLTANRAPAAAAFHDRRSADAHDHASFVSGLLRVNAPAHPARR